MKIIFYLLLIFLVSCSSQSSEDIDKIKDELRLKDKIIIELRDSIINLNNNLSKNKFTPYTIAFSDSINKDSRVSIPIGLYKRSDKEEVKSSFWIDDSTKFIDNTKLFWHPKNSASILYLDKEWNPNALTIGNHIIYGETKWKIDEKTLIENWKTEYHVKK